MIRRLGFIFGILLTLLYMLRVVAECLWRARTWEQAQAIVEKHHDKVKAKREQLAAYRRSLEARKMSTAFMGAQKVRAFA